MDFHHDTHTHPFLPATSGITSGTFVIPTTGETSANVWYRVFLTVTDSGGRTHTVQRDIFRAWCASPWRRALPACSCGSMASR